MTPDSAAVAAIGRDVVVGLEWFIVWNGRRSETLVGPYEIAFDEPRYYVSGPGGFSVNVSSEDEAKAAAQADYATRILSAIDPAFIARIEALEAALGNLERSASEVARMGATPGRHFVKLTSALLSARATLRPSDLLARTTQDATNAE